MTRTTSPLSICVCLALLTFGCQSGPAPSDDQGTRAALAGPAAAAARVDAGIPGQLQGKWKNQLGSTMTITSVDANTGLLTGTYRTAQGAGGADYPLTGWVNSAAPSPDHRDNVVALSFTVRWGAIGSVTGWTGYLREVGGNPRIVGQWLLARPNSDFEWDHILAGQDRFQK